MRGNYKPSAVGRTTSEERVERSRGWGGGGKGRKCSLHIDQGYGRGGTPIFPGGVSEPLALVALHPTDEDGSGTWFAAA